MTRDDVMRLEGRELDAAVAGVVFGLRVVDCDPVDGRYGPYTVREGHWTRVDGETYPLLDLLPEYSTDIAAAWEVVERLTEFEIDGLDLTVEVGNVMEGWACWVYSGCEEVAEAREETAPLAICRAALLAVAERLGEKDRSE